MLIKLNAILLIIFLGIAINAQADCPDGTHQCDYGVVGWSDNCWKGPSWKPFRPFGACVNCGHYCPSVPTSKDVPNHSLSPLLNAEAQKKCRDKILDSGSALDGCSVDFKDPASKAFKAIFDHSACDEHDLCYRTAGISQQTCDDNFENNMKWACDYYYKHQLKSHPLLTPLNEAQYLACISAANVWSSAVRNLADFAETRVSQNICDYNWEVDKVNISSTGAFVVRIYPKMGGVDNITHIVLAAGQSKNLDLKIPKGGGNDISLRIQVLGDLKYHGDLETDSWLTYKKGVNKTAFYKVVGATGQWSIILEKIE